MEDFDKPENLSIEIDCSKTGETEENIDEFIDEDPEF